MFVCNSAFMKQILCVVDFTDSSRKVLEVAAKIASACGSDLIVLYPYRLIDYIHHGDMASLKSRLEADALRKFQQLKETAVTEDLHIEFHPEIGFMADRINAYARRKNIDMIIIGQQQPLVENDPKGFNLQSLITNSQLPFVIVPAEVNVAVANV